MDYNYNYDYNQVQNYNENKPGSGFGIASLILGIISIVCCCGGMFTVFFPALSIVSYVIVFACGIIGVILGIVGLAKHQSKAMCIIGIILSALGIILAIITIILVVLGFAGIIAASLSEYNNSGYYY